jgi:hypothetical protein
MVFGAEVAMCADVPGMLLVGSRWRGRDVPVASDDCDVFWILLIGVTVLLRWVSA